MLERAATHGLWVYLDPHQDTWSRFTGGSGHPSWTLELVGMDVRKLGLCGAALLHQTSGDEAAFPRMMWPTNALKVGLGTTPPVTHFSHTPPLPPHTHRSRAYACTHASCAHSTPSLPQHPSLPQYAAATMFTLFWGGDTFAPGFCIRGETAQAFLQRHYIASLVTLATGLRGLPNLIGFGTMNEPLPGFIGVSRCR